MSNKTKLPLALVTAGALAIATTTGAGGAPIAAGGAALDKAASSQVSDVHYWGGWGGGGAVVGGGGRRRLRGARHAGAAHPHPRSAVAPQGSARAAFKQSSI